jgi:hypothetical protein
VAEAKRTSSDKGRRPSGSAEHDKGARGKLLSEKVRSALRAGKIPNRTPDRTSRGPEVGAKCPICDLPFTVEDLVEVDFAHEGDTGVESYHLHLRCYAAWEFERRKEDH